MVYSPNKVVACVKVDGKILREDKNVVTLPFGSEYSVFIKNLNASKVKVKVSIDGTDTTEGTWLVIMPNSELDLERFVRNGNWEKGNRFKFIERTSAVEDGPRGIKAEDGLIRIEYQVEVVKPKPVIVEEHHHHHHDHYDYPWRPSRPWSLGGLTKSSAPTRSRSLGAKSIKPAAADISHADLSDTDHIGYYSYEFPVDSVESESLGEFVDAGINAGDQIGRSLQYSETSAKVNDIGVTVPGSESNQSFHTTKDFESGPSEVIVLQLRGKIADKPVAKAVTVETKLTCVTCGKTSKSTEKFCGKCGTALNLI